MAVANQNTLNAKAREHTEWAIAWLEANGIPASIVQRGKHPSFQIERYGNQRNVVFSGTPSVVQPNAVFKDVRRAALELGYEEKVDREGRPVTAMAAAFAPKAEPKTDARHFRGIVIPEFPEEFKGRDLRGLSSHKSYAEYKKRRMLFVVTARGTGASNIEIHEALVAAGHPITSGVISLDLQEHDTGMSGGERKKQREALGLVRPRKGHDGEVRIPAPAKKVPLVTLNAIGLLVEEAARFRLSELIVIRDNLKRDADAFDEAKAAMRKEGSQLESLMSALTE